MGEREDQEYARKTRRVTEPAKDTPAEHACGPMLTRVKMTAQPHTWEDGHRKTIGITDPDGTKHDVFVDIGFHICNRCGAFVAWGPTHTAWHASVEIHAEDLVAAEDHVVLAYYRSLDADDGRNLDANARVWCESDSLVEVRERSEGRRVTYQRLVVTARASSWEDFDPGR